VAGARDTEIAVDGARGVVHAGRGGSELIEAAPIGAEVLGRVVAIVAGAVEQAASVVIDAGAVEARSVATDVGALAVRLVLAGTWTIPAGACLAQVYGLVIPIPAIAIRQTAACRAGQGIGAYAAFAGVVGAGAPVATVQA